MLKRLYTNNFRTLVNMEISFDPISLLLGPINTQRSKSTKTCSYWN